MRNVVAGTKLLAFIAATLPMMAVQWSILKLRPRAGDWLPPRAHRIYCRLLGIEVQTFGQVAAERPVLFVANHASWIDILALSTLVPVSFIAKSEVAGWPLFGQLARLQRTIFVERRAVRSADARDDMHARLRDGDSLVLFPEGTSSDGNRVLPFKSAFLAAAETEIDGRPVTVQPVTIAYTRLHGMPVGRRFRHYYAWYGDMDMFPHLWRVLSLGRSVVEIEFHTPLTIEAFDNRKQLAAVCQQVVAEGLSRALTGRRQDTRRPA